ncbi:hypothetical protein FACS1894190_10670 [Spirochaetia bacterium]|nr:hypothetical protein FACS1894190_10670 [Spirochaetia bacterium]
MKVVAFLPVKGTSERIQNKNTALLNGKPLFLHTLEKLMRIYIQILCTSPFINISTIEMGLFKLNMEKIKLIVVDVDGTLTDGGIYIDNNYVESKKFNVRNGLGIQLAHSEGIDFLVLTGRKRNANL